MRLGQRFSTLLIAAMAVLGLTMPIHAAFVSGLINVDFNRGESATATGAAVIGETGDFWNAFNTTSGSNLALVNANNAATDVVLNYSAGGQYSTTGSPVNPALLGDYLNQGGTGTSTVSISGLSDSLTYDLYVYSGADSGAAGRITDYEITGATTINGSVTFAWLSEYSFGQNYLKFTLAPDTNGEIVIAFKRGGLAEGNMNGFQITPVPEPTSLGAISLTALGLLRQRRT